MRQVSFIVVFILMVLWIARSEVAVVAGLLGLCAAFTVAYGFRTDEPDLNKPARAATKPPLAAEAKGVDDAATFLEVVEAARISDEALMTTLDAIIALRGYVDSVITDAYTAATDRPAMTNHAAALVALQVVHKRLNELAPPCPEGWQERVMARINATHPNGSVPS